MDLYTTVCMTNMDLCQDNYYAEVYNGEPNIERNVIAFQVPSTIVVKLPAYQCGCPLLHVLVHAHIS